MALLLRRTYFNFIRNINFTGTVRPKNIRTTATNTLQNDIKPMPATIILTEPCVNKLKEICTDGLFLRILVDGGGCSGFQYKFELDQKLNPDDVHVGTDKLVVIDSLSLDYCAGSTLDYKVELIKAGFQIVGNPKAEQGCSCGASFALKID